MLPWIVGGVVFLVLAIFGTLLFKGMAEEIGKGDAKEEAADGVIEAATRRQRMANRTRATGRALVKRLRARRQSSRS